MTFLYPFITYLQPGILWPALAPASPQLINATLALLFAFMLKSTYPRIDAYRSKTYVYMTLFIFVQVISVYFGGLSALMQEFSFWLTFALFVGISVALIPDVKRLRTYVWGMIVGGMVIVMYGIVAIPVLGGYMGTGRAGAYGMYENHNDYSFVLIQLVPFLYLFLKNERGFIKRCVLVFSLLSCAAGMALSQSRGGMIALVLEAGLIVMIAMEGRKRYWILPALAIVGAGAIAFQYHVRAQNSTTYTAEDAESSRYELWRAGRLMFEAHPLLGVGSRRFGEYSADYAEISHDQKGKNSHNTFIEIIVGSGLLGIATFLLAGRHLFRELRRKPKVTLSPFLDATRKATLISLSTIIFRGILDAKMYDLSFYTLGAIGIACFMLMRVEELATAPIPAEPDGTPKNEAVAIDRRLDPLAAIREEAARANARYQGKP